MIRFCAFIFRVKNFKSIYPLVQLMGKHKVTTVYEKFMEIYPNLDEFLNFDKNRIMKIIKSLGLSYRVEMLDQIAEKLRILN